MTDREFDADLADAVDCLVERHGREEAERRLQARDDERALEALAYLRREVPA